MPTAMPTAKPMPTSIANLCQHYINTKPIPTAKPMPTPITYA